MKPLFSIIIPFKDMDNRVRDCIDGCLALNRREYEIILLPDSPIKWKHAKCFVLPTGSVKPSVKRNIGILKSRGKFCAFIDSDAVPEKDWLSVSENNLKGDVVAVGGPNLLPKGAGLMETAGDDVLSSPVGAGSFARRYRISSRKFVDELPTCNLIVRKGMLQKFGGFDTSLLTAEDAKLCFQITSSGKKVLYVPELLVYHHRRKLFLPHAKQMWRYGRDKAIVMKGFFSPGKIIYLMPALFVFFIIFGLAASALLPFEIVRVLYAGLCGVYAAIIIAASIIASPRRFLLVLPGIFITHISYGLGFIRGLIWG